jgi:hypothetical protein
VLTALLGLKEFYYLRPDALGMSGHLFSGRQLPVFQSA